MKDWKQERKNEWMNEWMKNEDLPVMSVRYKYPSQIYRLNMTSDVTEALSND